MREAILSHLAKLVSFDTRNPPRIISAEGGLFGYLQSQLPGFELQLLDHGAGAVSLLAVRGAPKILFNAHMDTVPDSPAWSADPFTLRVEGDRAIGLGACDIKGAAAGLLAAAAMTSGPAAFLFSSDEEANDPCCIAAFLQRNYAFDAVLVAEPTQCRAVLAHRGISSVRMQFHGHAGHASSRDALSNSAVHQAMRWGHATLASVESRGEERFADLQGLRFNVGRVEGGIKANVIAPQAKVRFGFRPLPNHDIAALHDEFRSFAVEGTEYEETFRGPPLPACTPADAQTWMQRTRDIAEKLSLDTAASVDFWTEASLFSQAGYLAMVYGPGDIAQAHTADEWVEIAQLERYAESVARIIEGPHA